MTHTRREEGITLYPTDINYTKTFFKVYFSPQGFTDGWWDKKGMG